MGLHRDYKIIKKSGLFDEEYYLRAYPDVRKADIDPLWHFVKYGWREGRNPSKDFDLNYYLTIYPDVKEAGINPVVHYVKWGKKEGRRINQNDKREIIPLYYKKSNNLPLFSFFLVSMVIFFLKLVFLFIKLFHNVLKILKIERLFFPINSKRRVFFSNVYNLLKDPNFLKYFIKKYGINKVIKKFLLSSPIKYKEEIQREYNIYVFDSKKIRVELSYKDFLYLKGEVINIPYFVKPIVSILIPVYNQFNYTMSCIKSIFLNTKNIPYEIILIDDASTDETQSIKKYVKNITVIRNEKNQGFLLNCNKGAKEAKGKYLVFLNNDTIVMQDWLKNMLEVFEEKEKVGLVGPKFIYATGVLQEAGGIIWKDGSGWNYGKYDDPYKYEYNYLKEVDYISGACIMIKKDLWEKIGGFDLRYIPAYYEDTDLAFEVRKNGYKVIYQPKAVIIHFEGISHGRDEGQSNSIKRFQSINRDKFVNKWHDVLLKENYDNSVDLFVARDRSKNKKIVLVIDWQVPQYDTNAGARCTFHYLMLLNKLGFNVKFLPDDLQESQPYTTILQQKGIEVIFEKNFEDWAYKYLKFIDIFFIHRPNVSIKYLNTILKYKRKEAKIIYFMHDIHHLRYFREYKVFKDSIVLDLAFAMKNMEMELIGKSDMVYVVGEFEKNYLKNIIKDETKKDRIKSIPLFFYDTSKLGKEELVDKNFSDRKHLLFVGGFQHKPNKDAVLWFCKEIMKEIKIYLPDVIFFIVGSNPDNEILSLNSQNVKVVGYVSDEELVNYYRKSKMLVIPLRYGAGVKGKILEGMYYKIPVVTTPIGAEGIPEAKDSLIICKNAEEIKNSIITFYRDNKFLISKVEKSYEVIKKYFSEENAIKIIKEDFGESYKEKV
jgi:GT2 family glycosyltransferase